MMVKFLNEKKLLQIKIVFPLLLSGLINSGWWKNWDSNSAHNNLKNHLQKINFQIKFTALIIGDIPQFLRQFYFRNWIGFVGGNYWLSRPMQNNQHTFGHEKKYPDPAIISLDYQIIRMKNNFVIDQLLIYGRVGNIGNERFSRGGKICLLRGSTPIDEKYFQKLEPGESLKFEFITSDSFLFTSQGPKMEIEYFLEIVFCGYMERLEEIDGNLKNNRISLSGKQIALSAYLHYLQNYRIEFLDLINQYRLSNGCPALNLDNCLNIVAQEHSEWMKLNTTFSHSGKNGSNHQVRCQQAGCRCRAENLYEGGMHPLEALKAWQSSSSHNANLLGNFTRIGIGICGGWVTTIFD